jgi:hypothetical protein
MNHAHPEETQAYFLDQLCTISLVGGLGGVAVMMWQQDLLRYILAPQFHLPVLFGGITLIILVGIRAVLVWQAVGEMKSLPKNHGHDQHHHDHGHDHGHDQHHHDHGHDHGHDQHHHDHGHDQHHHGHAAALHQGHGHEHDHDHGWSPWRYAVLLLPIVMYFLDLPSRGFSIDYIAPRLTTVANLDVADFDPEMVADLIGQAGAPAGFGPLQAIASVAGGPSAGGGTIPLEFPELMQAAYVPSSRARLYRQTGRVLGQFVPGKTENTCTLVRWSMKCCQADAQPLNVVIISPEKLSGFAPLQWVEIEGKIQFRKRSDREEYIPVLQIKGRDAIRPAAEPAQLYL